MAMTRIVLELQQDEDLNLLMALLQRLNIRVVQTESEHDQPAAAPEGREFILKGLPAREDFDAFIRDFEKTRDDRALPGRTN